MRSYRQISSRLPSLSLIQKPSGIRKMSLFPRNFITSEPTTGSPSSSFAPLFRLLDDYETYHFPDPYFYSNKNNKHRSNNHNSNSNTNNNALSFMRTFQPKFDVKELADRYELIGELPGVEQKDVEIEFLDANTLSVRGRVERARQESTLPPAATAGAIEGYKAAGMSEALQDESKTTQAHKPTVEDEAAGDNSTAASGKQDEDTTVAPASSSTEVTESSATGEENAGAPEEAAKYWILERSIGEFARTFTFPGRVNQDEVKAGMKNGVLNVLVPKITKEKEGRRRIAIE